MRVAIVIAGCGVPVVEKSAWNAFAQQLTEPLRVTMHEHVLSEKIDIHYKETHAEPEQTRFLDGLVQLAKGNWQLKAVQVGDAAKAVARAKPKAKPQAKAKQRARGRQPLPRVVEIDVCNTLWMWQLFQKLRRLNRPAGVARG